MRPVSRRLATVTAVMTVAFLGAGANAGLASAHAKVVATSPGEGTTVTGDVSRIVIRFDDVITLVPHALTLTTDAGRPVRLESPRVVDGKTLMAFVQDHLATGDYLVGWRIMADDGHVESSTFMFSEAAANGRPRPATVAAGAPAPPAPGEPVWPVLVAAGIAAAAGLGAGLAVRRGLALVAVGASYPPEPADADMLRLPM